MKIRVTIGLLALLFLLTASFSISATDKKSKTAKKKVETEAVDSAKVEEPAMKGHKIFAYYVHGTRRCVTCKKLETYTKEAIDSGFAEQIKAGKIEWCPVNSDEKGNEHFIGDYKLYTKSVVLSEVKDGKELKWKNLDKIWELVRGDKEAYIKYIQDEMKAFLGES